MTDQPAYFQNAAHLQRLISETKSGNLQVRHHNLDSYPGMVLAIIIRQDREKGGFLLDLEWMALGLDLYGDTLQESLVYAFTGLGALLEALDHQFGIKVTDLEVAYRFDPAAFPDPIRHAAEKPVYEESWRRFQEDFRAGKFHTPGLKLVYDSSVADDHAG